MRLYKQNMRGPFFSCVRSILICIKFRFYVIFYFIKDSIESKTDRKFPGYENGYGLEMDINRVLIRRAGTWKLINEAVKPVIYSIRWNAMKLFNANVNLPN